MNVEVANQFLSAYSDTLYDNIKLKRIEQMNGSRMKDME